MSVTRKKELLACLGLLFVTLCWGLGFIFVKTSVEVIPPLYLLALRFSLACVILAVIFIRRLIASPKKTATHGLIIGLILFAAMVFQTYGCKYTTAGKNACLTTVYVILVPFLHFLFNSVRPRLRHIIAAVIGFWGIGLISLTERLTIGSGDLLTIAGGVCYAVQMVLIARYTKDDDPVLLVIWEFFITSVLSFAAAPLVSGPMGSYMFTADTVKSILFLAVFASLLGFGLQIVCQKYAPPAPAAVIMGMEALFGAAASYVFLGETMTPRMITGCAMLIAAMLLVEIDFIGYFYPDEYLDSAYDIDYGKLYEEGIRGLIFDIDNTLVMHDHPQTDRSRSLLKRLDEMGFKIVFLSNNKEGRVKSFRDDGVNSAMYLHKAGKPKRSGYKKAMEMMGTDTSSTCFIGDQLFTDVWGAKRTGIPNILVKPIDPKEEIQIVLKRVLESVVLSSYKRQGLDAVKTHEKKQLNY